MNYDKNLALKHNQEFTNDPNKKTTMRPCGCKVEPAHMTRFGSMRYCSNFLNIKTRKERKAYLRFKHTCYKCLQPNHNASVCKSKLKCMYCSLAGKPFTAHNSALCAYLNDQEFETVMKNKIVTHMVDSERKSQN